MNTSGMSTAQLRVAILYDRIYRLTGKDFGFDDDWVFVANSLCDWISAQKKEIGHLQSYMGKGE